MFVGGENSPSPSMIGIPSFSSGVHVSTSEAMSISCSMFKWVLGSLFHGYSGDNPRI